MQPNGPLPPEIYWRRRALAIGVAVVVIALLVWIVTSIGGGDESPESNTAASSGEMTTSSSGATSSAVDTGEPGQPGGNSTDTTNSEQTSAAPLPPGQCPDQSLAIKVVVERPNYALGEEPKFSIVITNISTTACERDLAPGMQQALVYTLDGQTRLWSSADCYPGTEPQVKRLEPGRQEVYDVTWSGTTSAPECAGERLPVPVGAYTAVGQLGNLRSAPEPFNIG